MDTPIDPSERRLRADLLLAEFDAGIAAEHWRFISLHWPILTVSISAKNGPDLGMRILVDSYPILAPSGQPWDLESDLPLPVERWPTGGMLSQVFSPAWSPSNGNSPYLACDRVGLRTHPSWATERPERAWNSDRTISFYLLEIHRELQASVVLEPQP